MGVSRKPRRLLGRATYTSLALHPTTGAPYVAYLDGEHSEKVTVMAFNGSAWSTVGAAGFSTSSAHFISLALHPTTGAPYVAYGGNWDDSGKATVMTFQGGSHKWVVVGTAGFSAGRATYTSLALHPTTGAPYVAYCDHGNSQKVTAMTFRGSVWRTVGPAGFSDDEAAYTSLALHPVTGAPYVAYTDYASSKNTTVMTFSDSAWSTVGTAGFATGRTSLALHPTTGVPYVATSTADVVDVWTYA